MSNTQDTTSELRKQIADAIRRQHASEVSGPKEVELIVSLIERSYIPKAQAEREKIAARLDELNHLDDDEYTWLEDPEQYKTTGRSLCKEVGERIAELEVTLNEGEKHE